MDGTRCSSGSDSPFMRGNCPERAGCRRAGSRRWIWIRILTDAEVVPVSQDQAPTRKRLRILVEDARFEDSGIWSGRLSGYVWKKKAKSIREEGSELHLSCFTILSPGKKLPPSFSNRREEKDFIRSGCKFDLTGKYDSDTTNPRSDMCVHLDLVPRSISGMAYRTQYTASSGWQTNLTEYGFRDDIEVKNVFRSGSYEWEAITAIKPFMLPFKQA